MSTKYEALACVVNDVYILHRDSLASPFSPKRLIGNSSFFPVRKTFSYASLDSVVIIERRLLVK